MPTKKVKATQEPADVDSSLYNERELAGPADALIESVKQYLQRTEGQTYSPERVKELSTKILESRL